MSTPSLPRAVYYLLSFTFLGLSTGCQSDGAGNVPGVTTQAAPNPEATPAPAPATRIPGETYDQARARHRAEHGSQIERIIDEAQSPESHAQTLTALDLSALPVVESAVVLQNAFVSMRDDRFLKDPRAESLGLRRIPWLFPDDGCYTRAQSAAEHLIEGGYPAPKKLFVFGNLSVESPNAIEGATYWWYHVAPAVRMGADAYILDPAIEFSRPLKLGEWLARMGADPTGTNAPDPRLAICDTFAYDAYSVCLGDDSQYARHEAHIDLPGFLTSEWDRLVELGRDPVAELTR